MFVYFHKNLLIFKRNVDPKHYALNQNLHYFAHTQVYIFIFSGAPFPVSKIGGNLR
jgi:hypothetical protein